MNQTTTLRGRGIFRPAERPQRTARPIAWRDVLRGLQDDATRSYALDRFRTAGFTADHFESGKRAPRQALAHALARTEDWLEIEHPRRDRERTAVRALRRRLEQELWP
jgi:hypothetical protein